ncbi:MAG TPA: hypothetical protein VIW29_07970 [Polyangiaceae bacterium]
MRIAPLLVFLGALQVASAAHAQEAQISDKARAHFQAGVNLMQDPDGARYQEAYREFSAAYADSPSWKILGNLGIAAMKLERDGEAITSFEKYLQEGAAALTPEESAQFQRDLDTLKAGVVRLTIDVNEPGATLIDERLPVTGSAVRNSYPVTGQRLEIGVRSGRHKIVARLTGREDAVWELDAVSGVAQSHSFVLKASAAPAGSSGQTTRPVPTGVWVGLAATGAFAIGAGVVGGMALGKNSDFQDANNGGNESEAQDLHDSVNTLNLVTDILIGAAVVSAGVTTYLYLSRPKVDVAGSGWIRVQPELGLNAGALRVTGAF